MHLGMDISNALQQLETIKAAVDQSDDPKLQSATNDDLNFLINLLESPVLRSIATLSDSMAMLATQVAHHPSILPADFEITQSGELELQSRNLYGGLEAEEEQRVPQISPSHSIGFPGLASPQANDRMLGLEGSNIDSNMSHQQAISILQQARGLVEMVVARSGTEESGGSGIAAPTIINGEWAQVQVINLVNDGTGLGFGIIGARTSGVIVKTILAGGVADRDGRLRSGDHILQIGDAHLLDMISEQVAGVLRASGTRVRLVVARPADPSHSLDSNRHSGAPVVPARLLTDPEALDRYLVEVGLEPVFNIRLESPSPQPQSSHDLPVNYLYDRPSIPDPESDTESPEVDRFTVQLQKDENGLGITIAGYVCEKEELSGIFVKSVTAGSAAALSGRIQVNDRIVAVDGVSLAGQSNQRAVDALKSSGHIVTLQLERYLRGPKYEQLQQAIAANEIAPSSTPAAINPFLDMHRPDTSRSSSRSPGVPDIQMTQFDKGGEGEAAEGEAEGAGAGAEPSAEALRAEEEAIVRRWRAVLGAAAHIVVGRVRRRAGGGLGISLEGTVDVEGGREVRPHHYVRSVLAEGPVGRAGRHRPGDELLEVNGRRLLGVNHLEVVAVLKDLPPDVVMVCARPDEPPAAAPPPDAPADRREPPPHGALVKAKSDGSLAGAGAAAAGGAEPGAAPPLAAAKLRSRSLEPLTGLAMWAEQPQVIELVKGERGLGFSILDYQDPLRPARAVVVIRSLVPGGVAQQDGRLIPGDRLLFVNQQNLENASLDQAVQALKGAPRGVVRIGVAKPLPLADNTPPPSNNSATTFNKMNTQ